MSDAENRFKEVRPIPSLNLPDVMEADCKQYLDEDTMMFLCIPKRSYRGPCPHCGEYDYHVHGRAQQRHIHDVSMGTTSIELYVNVPRYFCNDCERTFSHPYESFLPNQQFTKRLYAQIKERALQEPFNKIAEEYGISKPTVANILKEYADELCVGYNPIAPRVLGIDEKHIVHKMRGVLVDIENGILLEMTPDNKQPAMKKAIESLIDYDKNIEVVTIDMSSGYVSVIEEILPHAKIIVDKFHVIQNLYRKVETTRKRVFSHLKEQVELIEDENEKAYKKQLLTKLGKNTHLFKFGNTKLAEKKNRMNLMTELISTFPELKTLYFMKDGISRIYEETERVEAEKRFEEWAAQIPKGNELFDEMMVLYRSMKRWHKYIFNYFDTEVKYTNAATEGLNNLIGNINNAGRGYSFEVLRIKCLFHKKAKVVKRETRRELMKEAFNTSYCTPGSFGYSTPVRYKEYVVHVPVGSDIDVLNELLSNPEGFI